MRKPIKLDVACPNSSCRCYNKVGLLNIIRHGVRPNGTQNYRCTECKRQFVRTINTPFYGKRLPKKEIIRICKDFVECKSLRGIARSTEHHLDTVRALATAMANHCEKANEFLLHDVKLGINEIDEFWSFVKKNKKRLPNNFSQTLKKAMHTLTYASKEKQAFS